MIGDSILELVKHLEINNVNGFSAPADPDIDLSIVFI